MTITVTQRDIDEGNNSKDGCPLTVALRRYFNNKNISVSRNFIRVAKKSKDKWELVPLPKAAQNFMLNYYKYFTIETFKFQLPDKHAKLLKG